MGAIEKNTGFIRELATRYGFDHCGIAKAVVLDEDARRLETWLNKGMHGSMEYMEKNFDLRIDPARLVPGAKSVVTLLLNYFPSETQATGSPQVAKYAYGADYHDVIRGKLRNLLAEIKAFAGEVNGRGFVDSAPVLERSWATRAGLGWIGKNGNLINKNHGSFFFIATLIIDLELEYDHPGNRDYCGTCTRCIDSCPTGAILPGKVVDGSKCIAYYTIELKDALLPEPMRSRFDNWMFGCDVCQDVCPWNRFASPNVEPAFEPVPAILNFSTNEWEELTEEAFKAIFRNSPLKRSKFTGIKRNLRFLDVGSKPPPKAESDPV
jgi:epoxyqueuosine reductase